MFKQLFKSKTFIVGLASALTGAVLTITGQTASGTTLLITGISTMLGRQATEKVKMEVSKVNDIIQQSTVDKNNAENLPN